MELKDYKVALDNLLKTKIIYDKIATYKDTLESIIYKKKVNQLETLIRLCAHNLNGAQSEAELAALVDKYPEKATLVAHIEQVKSSTRREKIEQLEEITINNKTVPLKTEKLKQIIKKVESHLA